jgi:hypothetical protein
MTTSRSPTPPHHDHRHLSPSFLAVTGIATLRSPASPHRGHKHPPAPPPTPALRSPASRSSPHPLIPVSLRVDHRGSRRRCPPSPRLSLSPASPPPPAPSRSSLPPPAQTASLPLAHPHRRIPAASSPALPHPLQPRRRPRWTLSIQRKERGKAGGGRPEHGGLNCSAAGAVAPPAASDLLRHRRSFLCCAAARYCVERIGDRVGFDRGVKVP